MVALGVLIPMCIVTVIFVLFRKRKRSQRHEEGIAADVVVEREDRDFEAPEEGHGTAATLVVEDAMYAVDGPREVAFDCEGVGATKNGTPFDHVTVIGDV